jgi:hypothetical protein
VCELTRMDDASQRINIKLRFMVPSGYQRKRLVWVSTGNSDPAHDPSTA